MADINLTSGVVSTAGTIGPIPTTPTNANDGNDVTGSQRGAGISSNSTAPKAVWKSTLDTAYEITSAVMRIGGNNVDFFGAFTQPVGSPTDPGYIWARLEHSTDNVVWTEAAGTYTHSATTPDVVTCTFSAPLTAQHWRIYYQGHYANRYFGGVVIYTWQLINNTDPVCAFECTPLDGFAALTVQCTDLSTNNPTAWLWVFGDGQTSTQQNPTHVYTSQGVYTVTLTVNNEDNLPVEEGP